VTLSREVQALIAYVDATGLGYRVTSTYRKGDPARHGMKGTGGDGLAVDFAGPKPGDTKAMFAIYRALLPQAYRLRELIFWAPGVDVLVRRRVRVVPGVFDPSVLAAHRDHVHASVDVGTFLEPQEADMPADDEKLPNLVDLKFFVPIVEGGLCTGYYMVSSTGEVHGHGPGAPYHGRSEVVAR
jgi:hypothetical protein